MLTELALTTRNDVLPDIDVLPDDIHAPIPLDDFQVLDPELDDIFDAVSLLDGFREFVRESRTDNLTFGNN
jgi:hypothetical protein